MKENRYTKAKRFLWRKLRTLDFVLKWNNEARYIVERKIFPDIKNKRVLLVGVEKYADFYPALLEKNQNGVWSIDINPQVSEFGAKKHILGDICKASEYFKKEFFDVILLGGVFGYGLNKTADAEKAMKECYKILKKEGLLIIWWSNSNGHNQIDPKKLQSYGLFSEVITEQNKRKLGVEKTIFNFLKK